MFDQGRNPSHDVQLPPLASAAGEQVTIEYLGENEAPNVSSLIRRNLEGYHEAGSVLASSFRRLAHFWEIYTKPGSLYVVAKSKDTLQCLGGAGLGPLHGLAPEEGVGEIRDLVVDPPYRGQGVGGRLLKRAIEAAKALGYRRLYLETTQDMEGAQKLFLRFGFRPVTESLSTPRNASEVPCYFILEDLTSTQ